MTTLGGLLHAQNNEDSPCITLEKTLQQIAEQADFSLSVRLPDRVKSKLICNSETLPPLQQLEQLARTHLLDLTKLDKGYSIQSLGKISIRGTVNDREDRNSLQGATVFIPQINKGTTTIDNGYFHLEENTELDSIELMISYVGYIPHKIKIQTHFAYTLSIELQHDGQLPEVLIHQINQSSSESILEKEVFKRNSISKIELYQLPSFFGTTDVMRFASASPSVNSGTDAVSQLRVRGGTADENLVLLDGVPLFHPTQVLGFTSVFNSAITDQAAFFVDNYSAEMTGRLSSIIDVKTKTGNLHNWHGQVDAGLINTGLSFNGPIIKNKLSISLAGRKSLLEPWYQARTRKNKLDFDVDGETSLGFYDANAKITYLPTDKAFVNLSMYRGRSDFNDKGENLDVDFLSDFVETRARLNWTSTVYKLDWRQQISNKMVIENSIYHTAFEYNAIDAFSYQDSDILDVFSHEILNYRNQYKRQGLKSKLSLYPSINHKLTVGLDMNRTHYSPSEYGFDFFELTEPIPAQDMIDQAQNLILDASPVTRNNVSIYAEDVFTITPDLVVQGGLNVQTSKVNQQSFTTVEPRLIIDYKLNDHFILNTSLTRIAQHEHALRVADNGFANRTWVPVENRYSPSSSDQLAVRLDINTNNGWDISLSSYFKKQADLIRYRLNAPIVSFGPLNSLESFEWDQDIVTGEKRVYGIETTLKKSLRSRDLLTLNVSFADAQERYEDIFNSDWFQSDYFRKAQLNIGYLLTLTDQLSFNVQWTYAGPSVLNLPAGIYELEDSAGFLYDNVGDSDDFILNNNAFHRLDLTLNYFVVKDQIVHRVKLGLFNAYNRQNLFYDNIIELDRSTTNADYLISLQYGAPVLPTLHYSLSF